MLHCERRRVQPRMTDVFPIVSQQPSLCLLALPAFQKTHPSSVRRCTPPPRSQSPCGARSMCLCGCVCGKGRECVNRGSFANGRIVGCQKLVQLLNASPTVLSLKHTSTHTESMNERTFTLLHKIKTSTITPRARHDSNHSHSIMS